jgi:hypothetical protein
VSVSVPPTVAAANGTSVASFSYGQATLYTTGALVSRGFMVAPQSFSLGSPSAGVTSYKAFIAEVLLYDRPLSDGERQAVEAVLSQKYALPLPPGHPYASISPLASQSASNSGTPSQSRAYTYTATATGTATPLGSPIPALAGLYAAPPLLAQAYAEWNAGQGLPSLGLPGSGCFAAQPAVLAADTAYAAGLTVSGMGIGDTFRVSCFVQLATYILLCFTSSVFSSCLHANAERQQRVHLLGAV